MQIDLPEDISKSIEKASIQLGLNKKEVITRAIILYLKNVKEYAELQVEMAEWEEAGIEDLINWEKANLKNE